MSQDDAISFYCFTSNPLIQPKLFLCHCKPIQRNWEVKSLTTQLGNNSRTLTAEAARGAPRQDLINAALNSLSHPWERGTDINFCPNMLL